MQDVIKIESRAHQKVVLRVIPGHFATPNSHVNYYLDMTALKARQSEAEAVAVELSKQISATKVVDTIVCMDGCEIIGSYLAEELTKAGIYSMNSHKTMYIITPEYGTSGQMLFREKLKADDKREKCVASHGLCDHRTDDRAGSAGVRVLRCYDQRHQRDIQCG